jgi:hypothetical protein
MERIDIQRIHKDSGVSGHLSERRRPRRQDWSPERHRFEYRQTESFMQRRQYQE